MHEYNQKFEMNNCLLGKILLKGLVNTCKPAIILQSKKGRKIMVIPTLSMNLLPKVLDLSKSCLLCSCPKNTDWMFGGSSILYLGTQNSFLLVRYPICSWNKGPENWELVDTLLSLLGKNIISENIWVPKWCYNFVGIILESVIMKAF